MERQHGKNSDITLPRGMQGKTKDCKSSSQPDFTNTAYTKHMLKSRSADDILICGTATTQTDCNVF